MKFQFDGFKLFASYDSRMDKVSEAFASNKKLMRSRKNIDGKIVRINGRLPEFLYYITDEVFATLTPMRYSMFNVRVSKLLTYRDCDGVEHVIEDLFGSYNVTDNQLISYIKQLDPDDPVDWYPFYDSSHDTPTDD